MRIVSTALLWALLLAGGCSDPPNVGAACTAMGGCDDGLMCDVAVPGGYCTAACTTAGVRAECPEGSVCDSLSGTGLTCTRICKQQTDCRSELECNGTSGSDVKACKPKA
jgi:hypothetical protein